MRRLNDERGAAAVVTAILLVMLIGFTALAVDVGALWWDKKELQNGADAAALALAQSCAQGDACPDDAVADGYATENKSDSNVTVEEVTLPTSTSVRVTVSSVRDFWFAPVIGQDSGQISASATASWGGVGGATVLPLTVSNCYFKQVDGSDLFPGTEVYLPLKKHAEISAEDCHGGGTHYIPGGFGWLVAGSECTVPTDAGGYADSDTGANVDQKCESYLMGLVGKTLLLPVFDHAHGTGANGKFRILGYAQLEITSYCFSNSGVYGPDSGACKNNPDGKNNPNLWGKFVKSVPLDAEIGEGEDYGVTTVELTE